MKRSLLVEGYGIPLTRVLTGPHRHDSPLPAPSLDKLDTLGPLPARIPVHLDSGYDSGKTRDTLAQRGLHGQIARTGTKAPTQATSRWHVERTHAWHNGFNRRQRCYEHRHTVIEAFLDLADTIITGGWLDLPSLDHPPLGHQTDQHTARDLPAYPRDL
ncbi:hypothetical protein GCM10023320_40200 [Pseudonocardia adelaidensis]|uniref:Transposase IS4-like domain-containing protein n=1 Tax=Pseudonocardia adelaidensis TaxID=648754 RepID=A0ABP9NL74_9PSEU